MIREFKACAQCGRKFEKSQTTSNKSWLQRKYCGASCSALAIKADKQEAEAAQKNSAAALAGAINKWRIAA